MRNFGLLLGVLIGVAVSEQPSSAQILDYTVFERTLEALRIEAGIPAISAVIVQDGKVAWARGLGRQDLEGNVAARPDTPYVIGSLAQTLGSTVLLRKCVDQSYLETTDRVVRWMPAYPETETTVGELLSHIAPDKTFHYCPVATVGIDRRDRGMRGPKVSATSGTGTLRSARDDQLGSGPDARLPVGRRRGDVRARTIGALQ